MERRDDRGEGGQPKGLTSIHCAATPEGEEEVSDETEAQWPFKQADQG